MPVQMFTRANTFPDLAALYPAVAAIIGTQFMLTMDFGDDGSKSIRIDRGDAWTAQQISDVQAAVTNTVGKALMPPSAIPFLEKTVILTLIDETNRLRAALRGLGVTGLPDVTTQMAISAWRTKVGTL